MRQYLEHSLKVLTDSASGYKPNRTGVDSISRFGHQNEYELDDGFPLLTTKRMPFKMIAHELMWFLRGDTNIKYLVDNNVPIWNGNAFQHYLKAQGLDRKLPMYSEDWKKAMDDYISRVKEDEDFAREHGNLGDVYGAQWRRWKASDGTEIDQLGKLIETLRKSPQSRRMIVSAWNPEEVPNMALPPCHVLYHINVQDDYLDLQLYQRSCDMFLGVPFNIASYALLTEILAKEAGLFPGLFIHSFGDAHFYCGADERGAWYGENLDELKKRVLQGDYLGTKSWIEESAPAEAKGKEEQDHVVAILEQLSREAMPLSRVKIADKPFDRLTADDFELVDYNPHPQIRRAMAV